MSPAELLESWLETRVPASALAWLRERLEDTRRGASEADFFLAFGLTPRKTGREPLSLGDAERASAEAARPGWRPESLRVDQAARTALLLSLASEDEARYVGTLERLVADADEGELVVLYRALPLYAHPKAHRGRAAEGIRTNMKTVFDAIATDNPYPSEELDDAAWNQLVVKCLFMGTKLIRVQGFDARNNAALAKILVDHAHERWAAGRPVSPEIWRSVGPFADGAVLADLERVFATGTDVERAAVALAIRHNPNAEALVYANRRHMDRWIAAHPTIEAIAATLPD
ncbi:MAG TPA: EboA domain-containing protein [Polyangiaceae bacterium]|nr:EboA domain-containing protein [Polyangiaceae bacterium]